jgi:hypothetical protein
MRKQLFYTLFIIVLFAFGCKKNSSNRIYTISGKLLESTGNPVAVKGYKLTLFQNRVLSFLGSYYGVEEEVLTDNEGRFTFSYSLKSGTGLATGGTNPNPLYINSYDTSQYAKLYPEYSPISVRIDTNMQTIYLFKKINKLVRKVNFTMALSAGETLDVITSDASGATYNKINGPVSAGSFVVVDTISNYKIARLDLESKQYTILSALKKPSYQKDLNIFVNLGDEDYREILMTY